MYLCCLSLPKAFSVLQFLFSVFYIPEIQMKKRKGYDLYIVDRKKRRRTPPFQLAIVILLYNLFKSRNPAWEMHLYLHELSEWNWKINGTSVHFGKVSNSPFSSFFSSSSRFTASWDRSFFSSCGMKYPAFSKIFLNCLSYPCKELQSMNLPVNYAECFVTCTNIQFYGGEKS